MKDLLLGFVADGAGVVKNQAGIFLALNLAIALVLQCANDLLRVMGIHLAAEGFYIKGFVGCHGNSQYIVGRLCRNQDDLSALTQRSPV